jgi:hypothetical protein
VAQAAAQAVAHDDSFGSTTWLPVAADRIPLPCTSENGVRPRNEVTRHSEEQTLPVPFLRSRHAAPGSDCATKLGDVRT